jgi:putative ABC transport system permease protein
MPLGPRIRSFARTLLSGSRLDRDLDDEMRAVIDELTERQVRRGLSPEAARRAAVLDCDGVEQTKERVREGRIGASLESVIRDVSVGWRGLRRQPGLAAVAIATLALGIGANVAIFSVVRAVLLRPLPYADPSRLVFVWDSSRDQPLDTLTPGRLTDLTQRSTSLSAVAGIAHAPVTLIGRGEPERVLAASVSSNFFRVLGVEAAIGRTFAAGGASAQTVVLAHSLWVRRFAANPAIVGRAIVLGDSSWTVVGVMPADFVWPVVSTGSSYRGPHPELWLPAPRREIPALAVTVPGDYAVSRDVSYLRAVARVAPGVSDAAVARDLDRISRQLETEHPASDKGRRLVTVSAAAQITGGFRRPLLVLLGAVGLVLVVACGNVANLLLARTLARRGEISLRMALGAGRRRLMRQFGTESLILTGLGAAAGVALAHLTLRTLILLCPADVVRLDDTRIDPLVLLFAVGLAVVTGLVLGLVPLLQLRRLDAGALREAGRRATRSSERSRRVLVVSEVAVAVALVIGASLLVRSFLALRSVDVGIESPAQVLAFDIFLSGERARQRALQPAFYDRLLADIRRVSGVRTAGAAVTLPIGGDDFGSVVLVEGEPAPEPGREERNGLQVVTPGYFATLGIPLLAGRDVDASDSADAPRVALVNEAFARRHWPGGNAIGRRVRTGNQAPWLTVVGLVRDIRHLGPSHPARPEVYLPHWQSPFSFMAVVIRAERDPLALAPTVRRVVAGVDPSQPIANVNTMAAHLRNSIAVPRFLAVVTAMFGTLSLLLAGLGVHGVMAWSVVQRRREIGTRIAMGASASEMAGMVVRQGAALVAAGALAGVALAAAVGRLLSSLVDGVPGADVPSCSAALAALVVVAGVSLWLPAYRASRVDPATVLRE